MMSRFNDVMGAEPAEPRQSAPTAAQIAATGGALPTGKHALTDAQQRAWFGGVVFAEAVAWEEGAGFVCGGATFSPQEVWEAAQAGRRLGQSGGAQ